MICFPTKYRGRGDKWYQSSLFAPFALFIVRCARIDYSNWLLSCIRISAAIKMAETMEEKPRKSVGDDSEITDNMNVL
jgi:endogenous inhibitor of DNA gyrase (YacG/DUF329 family)